MKLQIVGGGLAGLVAAVEAASQGAEVRLYEAHETLGGRARTSAEPYIAHEGPHVVYADGLETARPAPIGVTCRLCHRPNCLARSAPPIGREIRSDRYREPAVPYPFAGD